MDKHLRGTFARVLLCVLAVSSIFGTSRGSFVWSSNGNSTSEVATLPLSFGSQEFGVNGTVVLSEPSNGCSPLVGDVAGKVVLVNPDMCYPFVKAKNAADAGASAVVLRGYQDTFGLLPFYNGPSEGKVAIPVVEMWRSEELVKEGDWMAIVPNANPIEDFGMLPWIFYSAFLGLYNIAIFLYAGNKLVKFLREKEKKDSLPFLVLGLVCLTCAIRIPILIDPTGWTGVYAWGTIEAFSTIDFSFAIVSALITAFHFDSEMRKIEGGTLSTDSNPSERRYKTPVYGACVIVVVLEVACSVMKAMLFPAKEFMLGSVVVYFLTSAFVAIYFFWSGRKILAFARRSTGNLTGNNKRKALAGGGVAFCLLAFTCTTFLTVTRVYDSPKGYFTLRFVASFLLYSTNFLLSRLFEADSRSIETEAPSNNSVYIYMSEDEEETSSSEISSRAL